MVATRKSSRAAKSPERTVLQLERDHVSAGMSMDWLPQGQRPNLDSRGIRNGGNLCYQSSVLQALLHQPPFLQFISQHSRANCEDVGCFVCVVKSLVLDYWGDGSTRKPVNASAAPGSIAMHSWQGGGMFERFEQGDAWSFYNWILSSLAEKAQNRKWLLEFEALYRINIQSHDMCLTCGSFGLPPMDTPLTLDVGVATNYASIIDAIQDSFHHIITGKHCQKCQQNRTVLRDCEIVAAPKILVIAMKILSHTGKIIQGLPVVENLDLTHFQKFTNLPLQYKLSSVIAHFGGSAYGHYVATVRGQNANTYTCISDAILGSVTHAEFLANPQRPKHYAIQHENGYQVYLLSYIRDDSVRAMPAAPSAKTGYKGRLRRELRSLM